MSGHSPSLRLGVVPYLNVAPLIWGLDADPRFEIVRDRPARLVERLLAGEIDLGTIPSAEYPRAELASVRGIAIGSRGAVRSVRFFHRKPIEEIRRVALDWSSRSSSTLLRILLRARLGREPEYVERPPALAEMLEEADAALLIGDAALYADSSVADLDLGAEWEALTGRPFVYAFWAGLPGAVGGADGARLQAAVRGGLAALSEIACRYAAAGNGTGVDRARAALNETYLREHVRYGLEAEAQAGLEEFYARAFAQGLIPRVPTLRFYDAD
jgi:chorismate dehydratase